MEGFQIFERTFATGIKNTPESLSYEQGADSFINPAVTQYIIEELYLRSGIVTSHSIEELDLEITQQCTYNGWNRILVLFEQVPEVKNTVLTILLHQLRNNLNYQTGVPDLFIEETYDISDTVNPTLRTKHIKTLMSDLKKEYLGLDVSVISAKRFAFSLYKGILNLVKQNPNEPMCLHLLGLEKSKEPNTFQKITEYHESLEKVSDIIKIFTDDIDFINGVLRHLELLKINDDSMINFT